MEISGKILREVEFRDRLRGYDTDEVDEFLEKVAVGVDEMRAELVSLRDQLAHSGRRTEEPAPVATTPAFDDESIRRTLVLAQRTADLAISEAREEAGKLLEEARAHSETLVSQATDTARHLKEEAEFEAHERVDRLVAQRDRLERDIQALAHLLGSERDRLTEALKSALGFVTESLSLSDEMSRAVANAGDGTAPTPRADVSQPPPAPPSHPASGLPDVESELREDAAIASFGDERFLTGGTDEITENGGSDATLDPDEALWARWAQGADVDLSGETVNGPDARQFRFPHGGQGA